MVYFLLVAIAYAAVYSAELVVRPVEYYLACGFAYSLISFCAYLAARYANKEKIKLIKTKPVVLLLAYSAVNILAALLNWMMVNDVYYDALRDFYYYETINVCLILDTMDLMLMIAGAFNVYDAIASLRCSHYRDRMPNNYSDKEGV